MKAGLCFGWSAYIYVYVSSALMSSLIKYLHIFVCGRQHYVVIREECRVRYDHYMRKTASMQADRDQALAKDADESIKDKDRRQRVCENRQFDLGCSKIKI